MVSTAFWVVWSHSAKFPVIHSFSSLTSRGAAGTQADVVRQSWRLCKPRDTQGPHRNDPIATPTVQLDGANRRRDGTEKLIGVHFFLQPSHLTCHCLRLTPAVPRMRLTMTSSLLQQNLKWLRGSTPTSQLPLCLQLFKGFQFVFYSPQHVRPSPPPISNSLQRVSRHVCLLGKH